MTGNSEELIKTIIASILNFIENNLQSFALDLTQKKELDLIISKINLTKALKHQYIIEIVYILQDLDKCFEFAKAREKITKRVVPKEVIENSFKDSISTTLQIKEIFSNSVILNLIDRVDNKLYEDISANEFYPRSHAERL